MERLGRRSKGLLGRRRGARHGQLGAKFVVFDWHFALLSAPKGWRVAVIPGTGARFRASARPLARTMTRPVEHIIAGRAAPVNRDRVFLGIFRKYSLLTPRCRRRAGKVMDLQQPCQSAAAHPRWRGERRSERRRDHRRQAAANRQRDDSRGGRLAAQVARFVCRAWQLGQLPGGVHARRSQLRQPRRATGSPGPTCDAGFTRPRSLSP